MNQQNTRSLEIWTTKERAELLKSIAKLPDPRRVAWSLPEHALYALVNAEQGRTGQYRLRHGVRDMAAGEELFRAGLVEARGPYIGNFGMAVRKHAIALLLERDGE
jgi:hypothetical protein